MGVRLSHATSGVPLSTSTPENSGGCYLCVTTSTPEKLGGCYLCVTSQDDLKILTELRYIWCTLIHKYTREFRWLLPLRHRKDGVLSVT